MLYKKSTPIISNIIGTNITLIPRGKKSSKILFIFICLFLFPSFSSAYTSFTSSPTDFTNHLTQQLITKTANLNSNRRGVVQTFCTTALGQGLTTNNEGQALLYDPRQSVFLYFLCNHVGKFEHDFIIDNTYRLDKKYLNKKSFSDLQLICKTKEDGTTEPEGCVPGCENYAGNDMGSCDFSLLLPPVMTTILNDYSNMGLGLAYGVYASEEGKQINDLLNEMAMKYFGGMFFNDKFDEYPRTLNHAKKFIRKARNFATRGKIINIKKARTLGNKKKSDECNDNSILNEHPVYDLFACPYSVNNMFDQDKTPLRGYINLMYNELFRYQLFVEYYGNQLKTNTALLPFQVTSKPVQARDALTEEALKLEEDVALITQSIKDTERIITNLHGAFRIHIGLYMYYEQAQKFRNALAQIYTPIHQMRYKFRNVQAKE